MRHVIHTLAAVTLALLIPVSAASAQTSIRDLVTLEAAGVSDDILIALMESDGSIFKLTAQDVLDLRRQGLSERVILAMLGTARRIAPATTGRDRQAAPVVADEPAEVVGVEEGGTPARREARVDVDAEPPVTVNVTQQVEQHVEAPRREVRTEYVQVPVPVLVGPVRHRPEPRAPEPVYWGWGGKQAPGTWQAPREPEKKERPAESRPGRRPGGGA